jgi:hypothetical protein
MTALTAGALFGFVFASLGSLAHNGHQTALLYVLLIVPIWGISSLIAVSVAYASEVYPTRIRSRGTGLAAGGHQIRRGRDPFAGGGQDRPHPRRTAASTGPAATSERPIP